MPTRLLRRLEILRKGSSFGGGCWGHSSLSCRFAPARRALAQANGLDHRSRGQRPDPYTQVAPPCAEAQRHRDLRWRGRSGLRGVTSTRDGGQAPGSAWNAATSRRRSARRGARAQRATGDGSEPARADATGPVGGARFRSAPDRKLARLGRTRGLAATLATAPAVRGARRAGARDARPTGQSSGGPPPGWAAGGARAAFAR